MFILTNGSLRYENADETSIVLEGGEGKKLTSEQNLNTKVSLK